MVPAGADGSQRAASRVLRAAGEPLQCGGTGLMLLILSASSFRSQLTGRHVSLDLLDLPRIAHEELELHGLAIPADFLKGWSAAKIEELRRGADKAACPALLLHEPDLQPLGSPSYSPGAIDRLRRVFQAAERLGCSSAGFGIKAQDNDTDFERVVESLKKVMEIAERLGLNMLIQPAAGLTETPDRVTELIKRVGGFRIGSLPDFEAAAATGDPAHYLRRLAPYAPVLFGSTVEFFKKGTHKAFDLGACAGALLEVGYDATVAIEYRGDDDIKQGVAQTRDELRRLIEEGKG